LQEVDDLLTWHPFSFVPETNGQTREATENKCIPFPISPESEKALALK